ncbi:hypothetical protein K474DRAFT_1656819 [Panus rudis PR-1116 ss-1]|nr:hypothetical protein K474DRAFT_1656819 [Panus rudis PR-1116 ss-1]
MPPASYTTQGSVVLREWVSLQRTRYVFTDANSYGRQLSHEHSILARRGPSQIRAEEIDHPPPVYTPAAELHAATLAPGTKDPSLSPQTNFGPQTSQQHVALMVAAILTGTILGLIAAVTVVVLIKSNRMRVPLLRLSSRSRPPRKHKKVKRSSTLPVAIEKESTQHVDFLYRISAALDYSDCEKLPPMDCPSSPATPTPMPRRSQYMPVVSSPLRRYSSPIISHEEIQAVGKGPRPKAPLRPKSLPSSEVELAKLAQQQKLAELAQIQRMSIIRDTSTYAMPSRPSSKRSSTMSMSGLGIIQEELEVDISSTSMSTLDGFSFIADESMLQCATSDVFDASKANKDPSASVSRTSLAKRISSLHSEPMSLESFDASFASNTSSMDETDILEEDLGEVRVAHARSMEIKKGVLVSLHGSPEVPQFIVSTPSGIVSLARMPLSQSVSVHSLSMYNDNEKQELAAYMESDVPEPLGDEPSHDTIDYAINAFPSPPPMLSPIQTSFPLFAEIEKGLENGVFDSGHLAGQREPVGWPWPGERTAQSRR